jgi:hypothetical protein
MLTNTLRTMRPLALTLAAAAVTAAALSACAGSSSGQPHTLPPITASASAPVSPSAAAGNVPVDAQAATSAGAEAFAKFFYAQMKRAFETKNPDLIKLISAPECTSCANYVGSVTELRDNNERVENFVVNVTLAVAPALTGSTARVDVTWSSPGPAIRYDASGKEIYRDGPYRRVDDEMKLVRSGDTWLVTSLRSIRRLK